VATHRLVVLQHLWLGEAMEAVEAIVLAVLRLARCLSYLKIGTTMSGCLLTSSNLARLKENIDLELSLSVDDRSNSGLVYLRDAYNNYETIMSAAPCVLKRVRFVKP
jgi:hypothetical protein